MIHELVCHALKMFRLMTLAIVLLHLSPAITMAAAGMASPLDTVRVVDSTDIRLSDVFGGILPGNDRVIGTAPLPGQDMVLNARTLIRLASAYNVSWEPTSASDQITIRRAGTIISPEEITNFLNEALAKRGVTGKYELAYTTPPTAISLPKNTVTDLEITSLDYTPERGNFQATLVPKAAPTTRVNVSGKVERLVDLPVARRPLNRGDTISPKDFDTIEIRASQLKNDVLTNLDGITDKITKRTIAAGAPLKSSDVETPLSLKRGDKITLLYRLGSMELSAQGRAQEEGHNGDRVRVINVASNKVLQGTVTADHQVTID